MKDSKTTVEQLRNKIDRFRKARNWNPSSKGLAISIVLESVELLENFQWDDYKKWIDADKVRQELADVIIYCLEFANANEIDISQVVEEKLKMNAKKFPAKLMKNDDGQKYYARKKASRQNVG